ncbi:MAG: ribbon-helix-helix domain-containing protein [Cuniculiplasma sp.]
MNPDSKDIKITLRISEDDLDMIDSFLEENMSYGSRSEFLRNCALDFIQAKKAFKGWESGNGVSLSKKQEEYIERMIRMGYYPSKEDAIKSILEYVFDSGFIKKIFEEKIEKYQEIEKSMRSNEKVSLVEKENEEGKYGKY